MTPSALRLDPKNDVVFKLIFTSSEPLLIGLLTAVLKPKVPVRRAIVRNPGLPKDFHDDKGGYLDIAVTLDDGVRVDVEMQADRVGAFCERALYYWAGLFYGQLASGESYDRLSKVVSVLFLDYRQFEFSHFHEVFHLGGTETSTIFSPLLEIHTIELPKLTRELAQVEPALGRWCRFFSSQDPQELQQLTQEDPMIEDAEKRLAAISSDPELREIALERHRRAVASRLIVGAARREGEVDLLHRLLTRKFGELLPETRARLEEATAEQLTFWAERILTAQSLSEVFGGLT